MAELLMVRPDDVSRPHEVDERVVEGLDRIGNALADPIRLRILVMLLDGSQCPSDLADTIGTSRSNLSNHLACLRGCGLVTAQRMGRHLHYSIVSDQLGDALRCLLSVAATLPDCHDHQPATTSTRSAQAVNS